jgi:hypothetical protein
LISHGDFYFGYAFQFAERLTDVYFATASGNAGHPGHIGNGV